ncbi:histidine triad nucleotide-binding protein [bacterium]|nr:histidine triad nucleotide-binding protein [bacterium]
MEHCVFCMIARGEVESKKVMETEDIIAFHDLNPQAPIHILIVPKKHIAKLDEAEESDIHLLGKLLFAVKAIAQKYYLNEGYRVVINAGTAGGQAIPHLHLHLLAGRHMSWPPG